MKMDWNSVDEELKRRGKIFQIISKIVFTKWGFPLLNKLSSKRPAVKNNSTMLVEQQWIQRKDGEKIRICIYRPAKEEKNMPGLLWLHGGGYILGSPEQGAAMAMRFMERCPCVVVAPEYRLSLNAPYPAALEDAYDSLLWMKKNAHLLGIRDDQLMVGGDSAGGGLTAALSLYARDRGEVSIAFQMPLYPMLDDRRITESSGFEDTPVWNAKANKICWEVYLKNYQVASDIPCYAAPSRATDFSGLPPTATFVGELEPFRDETIQYVESLRSAGVSVDFALYKGCYHAFEQMCPKAAVSKTAISRLLDSYEDAVAHYTAKQKPDPQNGVEER
ncbi:alpha/beta hydrolase fold domain-containing protein [Alkalibacter rhizosphaerae]|uniref:Alpha/beta hydrolase fold domain-containing protein n=1 Tax=Alkalibacter rhizosphaerae TaxID=2815577 RepID=A0A974XEA6_9FIRM|nr:alpha/beta hydrolase [Alkalibacter rhizosphaerae]QSX08248.1 alpha/beta hydrolase fold domain-containing protein [Alkalibacter rhizosphaerae]